MLTTSTWNCAAVGDSTALVVGVTPFPVNVAVKLAAVFLLSLYVIGSVSVPLLAPADAG